ncbi:hypothetical protein HPP92_023587 [Vanilla planifolia]|uniref:Transducin/WD40 repeat-like superfamily protein n=1 Tax=Vanilla planifolia TaxID=51239 RepID=A0A835UAJ2_VANPL|nr:hypothetical protein HPP92_023587 [Vanilla planifolia]
MMRTKYYEKNYVLEVQGKVGTPKVVETWGSPDASRSVIATSFADCQTNPLLVIARKNGLIELLSPLSGETLSASNFSELGLSSYSAEEDPVAGLHLFKTKNTGLSSGINVLLICTEKGKAFLKHIPLKDASPSASTEDSCRNWDISGAGKVVCSAVDSKENYALFGGKGIELNLWNLESCSRIWTAKPPRVNSLGIFSPTFFTAATFLSKEDDRKIAAGTSNFQIRLYDISAQRRPVLSIDFRESPIRVVREGLDGNTVYIGTGIGDLASFDMRTGKLLGCFNGKCCGSIRSIAKHPELPLLASCGLDSYVRIWDSRTRRLLSAVFLKQHLTSVMFDSHFSSGVLSIEKSNSRKSSTKKSKRKHGEEDEIIESYVSPSEDEAMEMKLSLRKSSPKKKKSKTMKAKVDSLKTA